jgi:hypothetical protein
MTRISIKDIEARISYLNKITGSPDTTYNKIDSKLSANIGNYHLSQAYGGCALYRIDNESGGVQDISRIGYASKKDIYNWINAYIAGIQDSKTLSK